MRCINVFPFLRPHHSLRAITPDLTVAFAIHTIYPIVGIIAIHKRHQTPRIQSLGQFATTPFDKCRHQIHQPNKLRYIATYTPWHFHQQWDPKHLIVHCTGFFKMLVTTHGIAVICTEKKYRIILNSTFPYRIQHAPHACINQRHIAVIFGNHLSPPRPIFILKIPFSMFSQMSRGFALKGFVKIWPGWNGFRIVHRRIRLRNNIGKMRCCRINSQKKWLLSSCPLAQHLDPTIRYRPRFVFFWRHLTCTRHRKRTSGKFDRQFCAGNYFPASPSPHLMPIKAVFLRSNILMDMPLPRIIQHIPRLFEQTAKCRHIF